MKDYNKKTGKIEIRPGIVYYSTDNEHKLVGKIKDQMKYIFRKDVQTTTIGKIMEERYRL